MGVSPGGAHSCPLNCPQASGRSLQLRRQTLVDSGTREFPCDTCGKAFRRKNHLDVHRRTHSGETPVE
uniref:Zinc finger protein 653 n=1 Tax=Columba livia TaxID=8932 RepID=R7VWH9_COLLI